MLFVDDVDGLSGFGPGEDSVEIEKWNAEGNTGLLDVANKHHRHADVVLWNIKSPKRLEQHVLLWRVFKHHFCLLPGQNDAFALRATERSLLQQGRCTSTVVTLPRILVGLIGGIAHKKALRVAHFRAKRFKFNHASRRIQRRFSAGARKARRSATAGYPIAFNEFEVAERAHRTRSHQQGRGAHDIRQSHLCGNGRSGGCRCFAFRLRIYGDRGSFDYRFRLFTGWRARVKVRNLSSKASAVRPGFLRTEVNLHIDTLTRRDRTSSWLNDKWVRQRHGLRAVLRCNFPRVFAVLFKRPREFERYCRRVLKGEGEGASLEHHCALQLDAVSAEFVNERV